MVRTRRALWLAALVIAMLGGLGSAPPSHAATEQRLDVVLVTQLTNWTTSFPYTETFAGTGVDTDLHVWTFTETVVHDHFLAYGTFSMQAGADGLSGTLRKSPSYVPFVPLTYDLEAWSYTVTDGQGAYAGCTGQASPVRERVTAPLRPPNGVVVTVVTFDLTCP